MRLMGYCYFDLPLFYKRGSGYLFLTVVLAISCLFGESLTYSVGDDNSAPTAYKQTLITGTAGSQCDRYQNERFYVDEETGKIFLSVRSVRPVDANRQIIEGAVAYRFGDNLLSRSLAIALDTTANFFGLGVHPQNKPFSPECGMVITHIKKGSTPPSGWDTLNSYTEGLAQKAQNLYARRRGIHLADETTEPADFGQCLKDVDNILGHAKRLVGGSTRVKEFETQEDAFKYIESAKKAKNNLSPDKLQVSQAPVEKKDPVSSGSVILQEDTTNTGKKTLVNVFPNNPVKPGDTSFQQLFGKKPPKT